MRGALGIMLIVKEHKTAGSADQLAPIRVYNTLAKAKQPLETVVPGKVGIYLCGPTVYKPSHIGHMVGPVIFDAVKRHLVYSGYQVTWVVNITDVDDKLIVESQRRKLPMSAVAVEMTADYLANLEAMGIDTVDHFPKATDNIDEIIRITQQLIDKGFAYASDGDVYFDVTKDREYGKLSGRSIESMVGEGGSTAERKRSAADFALWKSAKPGEPSWDSPWGKGRPGWHIECSAMSRKILGETFDIHGGGLDLVFPHHENEIAQSECCHGKPQAKYWMHNGLMQASSEVGKLGGRNTREIDAVDASLGDQAAQEAGKIGKSKGASPFRELLQQFQPETIRFFLLSTHYRRPIDFSEERIQEVDKGLETFYRFFKRYERVTGESFYAIATPPNRHAGDFEPQNDRGRQFHELRTRFLESMDDDFNTGGAIGDLFELVRALNKFIDDEKLEAPGQADAARLATLKRGAAVLRELAAVLGLFRTPRQEKSEGSDEIVGKLMQLLIEVRADARKAKNFAAADKVRKSLGEMGIILEDRPDGTDWTIQK
jgi:cysteinyl-tRNA synthetase